VRWLPLLATLSTLGCVFSPAALPAASPDGAPGVDAPAALDARADAPAAVDAAVDAEPDPCPGGSTTLALGFARQGSLGGASLYEPTCTTASGGEDLYRVDVGAASSADLVIDVEDTAPLDTVIDLGASCSPDPTGGACIDRGRPGGGEVLVVPFVEEGRRFVAVDSVAGQGGYTVRAYLRGVVGEGATCTPELDASRCQNGLHCLERDGAVACRQLGDTDDTGGNGTPCGTDDVFTGDGVFAGRTSSASDVDVVALDLAQPRTLRVVVHDGAGCCSADLVAEVLTGASCDAATPIVTDDDSGLGPCPRIAPIGVPAGRSWVRISPAQGAKVDGNPEWTMELDVF
jgi:hypothetical protein